MVLCSGIGNNEEDDHKTLSIVWSESLLVYGEHVNLIQSPTAETVQLCNTLTTMYTITDNFMQKKKALFTFTATGITLFIYLFHPCQNLQSGPLH